MPKSNSGAKVCNGQPGDSLLQTTIGASEVGTSAPTLFEGKYPFLDECFAYGQKIRIVDRERLDRGAANSRESGQQGSLPCEMFTPNIGTRMK